MASFDPSIISQIPDMAPNPAKAKQDAYTLYDENNRVQLNALTLKQKQEEESDRLAVKKIMQGADLSTDKGVNSAMEQVAKVSPDLFRQTKKEITQQKSLDLGVEMQKLQVAQERVAPMINSIDSVLSRLEKSKEQFDKGQITQSELDERTRKEMLPEIQRLQLNNPELSQYIQPVVQDPKNLTYFGLSSLENSTKNGRDMAKTRMDEMKAAVAQQRADTYQQGQLSLERHRIALEENAAKKAEAAESGERNKPEAGYEWKDPNDHSKGEVPIKGGSKDTEKPMTGREAQMFSRITTSANLGIAALKNISQLPSTSSTGLFGTGKGPGPSLLGSAKSALTNAMSKQETQTYSAMIAGLSRNLSTIETQGLAPPGSFTQSLSAIQFAEGDTGYTKLTKLAEARQIIEKGLEPSLDNPRVPKQQKDGIVKMLDNLRQAIPYTNEDVIKLMQDHQKNPKKTMNDVMKENKLDKPSADLPPGFVLDK